MRFFRIIATIASLMLVAACGGTSSPSPNTPGNQGPLRTFSNFSAISRVEIGRDFRQAKVVQDSIFYTDRFFGLGRVDAGNPLNVSNSTKLVDPYHEIVNYAGYDDLYDMEVVGNTAVILANNACLGMCMGDFREVRFYDISSPNNPKFLSNLAIPADHVLADGKILYISSGSVSPDSSHLYIMDISTPETPAILSSTPISDPGYLAKKGSTLYLSQIPYDVIDPDTYKRIQLIDVSDPIHPVTEAVSYTHLTLPTN
jgi:hypothetical protein